MFVEHALCFIMHSLMAFCCIMHKLMAHDNNDIVEAHNMSVTKFSQNPKSIYFKSIPLRNNISNSVQNYMYDHNDF